MKSYIGTQILRAEPMSKREWVDSQDLPYSSVPDEPGYKVFYDGSNYTWYPKDIFERCYRELTEREIELMVKLITPLSIQNR